MKVLHTYCLNYNLGDYALGIGMKNLLRNFLKIDLIGETNIQGREFNEFYINEVVNKRYDLLVIGGGGIIHGSHWPNGWFWLIDKELIRTIKIPFIVYGVGNNYFENENIPHKAVKHLKETYRYSSFFSVRNDGSYERVLKQTGINAIEVPDPGFYVGLDTFYKREEKEPYIIIQLANDKPEQRFKDKFAQDSFLKDIRKIIRPLSKRYKIILAPHVFEDIVLSKKASEGIENCTIWDFGYFAFDHPEKAVGYYKHAELVLAMRGHGQILPISFDVPVISLQNHPKHLGLMKKLGIQENNVDIQTPFFVDEVLDKINETIINKKKLKTMYKKINDDMYETTQKAFEDIKANLGEK